MIMETNATGLISKATLDGGGSFSLDLLEDWVAKTNIAAAREIEVYFEDTAWFDVAALVFLLCILSNQRSKGASVTLTLPDRDKHQKARDFLYRWNFRDALRHSLDNEISNVLPIGQLDYFDAKPQNYTPAQVMDEYGDLSVLSSLRLLEITSLTELQADGNYRVSFSKIGEVTNRASAEAMYSALQVSIGVSRAWATQFGRVLIHQALLNAFEHPEANVAFIAMARQGTHLVIGIADNGLTIPATINEAYEQHMQKEYLPRKDLSGYQLDANRIAYATLRGTSRKPPSDTDPERGMGLYYIKTLTAEVGGYLVIRASEASVMFQRDVDTGRMKLEPRPVEKLERGNLLKIFLPLAKQQSMAKSV
jgi:hypothetical protein